MFCRYTDILYGVQVTIIIIKTRGIGRQTEFQDDKVCQHDLPEFWSTTTASHHPRPISHSILVISCKISPVFLFFTHLWRFADKFWSITGTTQLGCFVLKKLASQNFGYLPHNNQLTAGCWSTTTIASIPLPNFETNIFELAYFLLVESKNGLKNHILVEITKKS